MKKYSQIIIILAIFFTIVFFRRHGANTSNAIDNNLGSNTLSQDNSFQNTNGQQGYSSSPSYGGSSSGSSSSSSGSSSGSTLPTQNGSYKNGTYDGSTEDAYYGNVQVRIIISNGNISNISFLQYPNDNNTSSRINSQALPMLRSEAIKAQSARINGISGASYSSQAFASSLNTALQKAS